MKWSKAYSVARRAVYEEQHESCGYCGRWCEFERWHLHHIKSRGSGGAVVDRENLIGLCWQCHRKVHDGNIRLCFR